MKRATPYDYLIIGGGVAGVIAAEEIRARDARSSILILSEEVDPLYSRVLLPHYVRGKIRRDQVFLRSFEQYAHHRIDLWTGDHVIATNYDNREVTTKLGKLIKFEKMLIATGGTPTSWPVDEHVSPYIFRLQTITDADRLHKRLSESKKGEKVLVIGGGFIALEFIESAVHAGLETHVFLRGDKLLGDIFDDAGWKLMLATYAEKSVVFHPEAEISGIRAIEGGVEIATAAGEKILGSWVGVGIGISRNSASFEGGAVEIRKGVVVNQFLESGVPHVWAAGDIAEYRDSIYNENRLVGNWTNAVTQGKLAGANMARSDGKNEFRSVSTYSITSLGNHITVVGWAEVRSGMTDLVRIWKEERGYERLFFEGDILRGAVIINRFKDKPVFARLIESARPVAGVKSLLEDPNADISNLIERIG